jgi:hypothetical protein
MVADNSVVNAISDYDFKELITATSNVIKNQEINLFLTKNLVTAA